MIPSISNIRFGRLAASASAFTVDALHELLVAAGVRIIKSLADKDHGLRAFVFADLGGDRIDVGQRIEGPALEPRRFENRDLTNAGFTDCRLAGAAFDNVDLSKASFSNVDLSGARLANINLSGVSIDNVRIDGLTISGIDIQALVRAELARRRGD